MTPFSQMDEKSRDNYRNMIESKGLRFSDYIGIHSRFLHESCDKGPCYGMGPILETFKDGKTYVVLKSVKTLYLKFCDRNDVFRFSVPSGGEIPSGHIVSKGWKVYPEYRNVLVCRCGDPEHSHDDSCDYNDH